MKKTIVAVVCAVSAFASFAADMTEEQKNNLYAGRHYRQTTFGIYSIAGRSCIGHQRSERFSDWCEA